MQPKVDSEADSILKTRPTLFDKMVLRVDTAFVPEARYQLEVLGHSERGGSCRRREVRVRDPQTQAPTGSG